MSARNLSHIARPLRVFGEALGDASPDWSACEALHAIDFHQHNYPVNALRDLTLADWLGLAEAYGEALNCRILYGDRLVLQVSPEINQAQLDDYRSMLEDVAQVELRFRLDKSRLLQARLGEPPAGSRIFVFFYPSAMVRYLKESSLVNLEKNWWPHSAADKVLLLLPERKISIHGEYLSIVGGNGVEAWRSALPAQPVDLKPLQSIYQTAQDLLKWQQPWLERLTPHHLYTSDCAPDDCHLLGPLRVHLFNLLALYTADRTLARGECWVSVYAGAQQSVEFDQPAPTDHYFYNLPQANLDALFNLFNWAYQEGGAPADRLAFLQIAVAQALHAIDRERRSLRLVEDAPGISQAVRWHWKSFVEGRIGSYVSQVQQLENYVSQTVRDFSAQVSDLVKSLSDTMLAAVGVLLGSFIASLFQNEFNPTIFRLGLWIYAGYVAFFPLLYNMRNQWERYQELQRDFQARRQHYEERLTPARVDEIVGDQVEASRKRFRRWFWVTVAAYLVVIALAVWASLTLPSLLATV